MIRYIRPLFVACIFCLTVLTTQAKDTHGTYSLPNHSKEKVLSDMPKSESRLTIGNTNEKLKAYPNPIYKGGLLTIEMPADKGELTVSLYNTVGKVVQTFKTSDKKVELTVPNVSGIYVLRFVEKQKVIAVEKIVVKE